MDRDDAVPGMIVQYHGTLTAHHGEYLLLGGYLRDKRKIKLAPEDNPDTMYPLRVRPASVTPTGRAVRLCTRCYHDADSYLPDHRRICGGTPTHGCDCRSHGSTVFTRC